MVGGVKGGGVASHGGRGKGRRGCIIYYPCCTLSTVVGEKEEQNKTVNVRTRDNVVHGEMSVEAVVDIFKKLASSHANDDKSQFVE